MKSLTRKEKEELVERMSEKIKKHNLNFLVEFSGLTVPEIQQIRDSLKEKGCEMQVVKNTLLERIYQKIGYEEICEYIQGPSFIIWANASDEIEIIKKIYDFQKKSGKITVRAGLIGNKLFSSEELQVAEKLPVKKEIEAKIVWNLRMPFVRILNTLNFPIVRLIIVLKQISEHKRKERENGKG